MTKPLFDEILSESRESSEKIVKDAERKRDEILEDAKNRAEERAKSERALFDERVRNLQAKEESEKRNIDRLQELKRLDALFDEVQNRIEKRFEDLDGDKLDEVLSYWIAEAALGIGENEVEIIGSKNTHISENALKRAEEIIKERGLRDIRLTYTQGASFDDFGIIARNKDGQISYANTLINRMKRYKREIRKIIQDHEESNRQG